MRLQLDRIAQLFLHPFEHAPTQVLMRHFPATEADGELHLIFVLQELVRVAHFGLIVVVFDARAHLDLFEFDNLLALAGLVGLFLLLVFELAEVHDLADRRVYVRRHLNEVEAGVGGAVERVTGADNAEVVAFIIDEANIRHVNIAIGAELILLVGL